MARPRPLIPVSSFSKLLSSSLSMENWRIGDGSKHGSVLTRVLWQVSFTLCLLVVWSILLVCYLQMVPPRGPRHYPDYRTPGLAFRPRPSDPKSTLIHFRHGGSGNWQPLVQGFKDFLKDYAFGKRPGGFIQCNYNTHIKPDERCGQPNIKWFDASYDTPCSLPEKFGMFHGQPCLIVKLNRVFGWEPHPYYNLTEIESLPSMPLQLKKKIRATWSKHCEGKGQELEDRCPQLRMVWLSCDGETAADKEWLGTVAYTPWQGFPGYYFPFHNQDHYLSPVVMVQFRTIQPGMVIQIRCKAWAKNIHHDDRNPFLGAVHIEMMMD